MSKLRIHSKDKFRIALQDEFMNHARLQMVLHLYLSVPVVEQEYHAAKTPMTSFVLYDLTAADSTCLQFCSPRSRLPRMPSFAARAASQAVMFDLLHMAT